MALFECGVIFCVSCTIYVNDSERTNLVKKYGLHTPCDMRDFRCSMRLEFPLTIDMLFPDRLIVIFKSVTVLLQYTSTFPCTVSPLVYVASGRSNLMETSMSMQVQTQIYLAKDFGKKCDRQSNKE